MSSVEYGEHFMSKKRSPRFTTGKTKSGGMEFTIPKDFTLKNSDFADPPKSREFAYSREVTVANAVGLLEFIVEAGETGLTTKELQQKSELSTQAFDDAIYVVELNLWAVHRKGTISPTLFGRLSLNDRKHQGDSDYERRKEILDTIQKLVCELQMHGWPERQDQFYLVRTQLSQWKKRALQLLSTRFREDQLQNFRQTADASTAHNTEELRNLYRLYHSSIEQLAEYFMAHADYVLERKDTMSDQDNRSPIQDPSKVFVVHGRNVDARDAMFNFLSAIGLQPLEWAQAKKATRKPSPNIQEILDKAFSIAGAVIVLFTPDDIAWLREELRAPKEQDHDVNPTPQARPNVLFEAGMAMGRYPERTVLVELGEVRPFTDISGIHIIRINNSTEKRQDLIDSLRNAGCSVDMSGRRWHKTGDFDGALSRFGPG